ncbi:MAG: hypothetical protein HZB16_08300 [Armatimonadetes bacterium]|nr:hypothetical protein [Armatimonadota bacterium]
MTAVLHQFARSPALPESARQAAALGLARLSASAVREADDPKGHRRAVAFAEALWSGVAPHRLVDADKQFEAFADLARRAVGDDLGPLADLAEALPRELSSRVAADYAVASVLLAKVAGGKPLGTDEKRCLDAVVQRWSDEYRPAWLRLPCDPLGRLICRLAAEPGLDTLRNVVTRYGWRPEPSLASLDPAQLAAKFQALDTPELRRQQSLLSSNGPTGALAEMTWLVDHLRLLPASRVAQSAVSLMERYRQNCRKDAQAYALAPGREIGGSLLGLALHCLDEPAIQSSAKSLVADPSVPSWLRDALRSHLAAVAASGVPAGSDPRGTKRASVFLNHVVGDLGLAEVVRGQAAAAWFDYHRQFTDGTLRSFDALSADLATDQRRRYVVDYAALSYVGYDLRQATPPPGSAAKALELASRWLTIYRPLLREPRLPDQMGICLRQLASRHGLEALADRLGGAGVSPLPEP